MFESGLASTAHSIAATDGWRVPPDCNDERRNECLEAPQKGRECRERREEIITEKEIETGVVAMNSFFSFLPLLLSSLRKWGCVCVGLKLHLLAGCYITATKPSR